MRALVPVYGISVTMINVSPVAAHIKCNRYHARYSDHPDGRCGWSAVAYRDSRTQRWRVDFETSNFEHSHGPCDEILQDPTWRPKVKNPDARRALGMPPLDGAFAKSGKASGKKRIADSQPDEAREEPAKDKGKKRRVWDDEVEIVINPKEKVRFACSLLRT